MLVAGLVCLALNAQAEEKSWLPDILNPRSGDRKEARKLAPVPLEKMAAGQVNGELNVVRLRIYADADYRGGVLHWQQKVRAQIDRVNRIVGPTFNVNFEVESLRPWNRSHLGVSLDSILPEIEALDPARDVDWVLGLVTSFKGVATSIHQIGGARLLGRHFLLRGMDDQEEARDLHALLSLLPVDEREALYEQRKIHKEVVIFLHEWAHTMGALHAEDRTLVMNPAYHHKQTEFTEFQRRVIALVVKRRLADRARAFPESADLLALMKDAPSNEGTTSDKDDLVRVLESRARPAVATVAGNKTLDIPTADIVAYNRAVDALNAGKLDQAWTDAAPLFERYPRAPEVLGLACSLVAGHEKAADGRAACDNAVKLDPGNLLLLLDAAASHVRAQAPLQAAPLLASAGAIAERAPPDKAALLRLGQLAGRVGALTVADAALARAGQEAKVRELVAELDTTRRRTGLPRDSAQSGVAPQDEADYIDGYWALAGAPARPDQKVAYQSRLAAFAKRFPQAPGTRVLGCESELRARRIAAATKHCQAAVASYSEAVRAHYLLGIIAAGARRDSEAEKTLRQAIQLDPTDPGPWRELAHLYDVTRASQKRKQLADQHQALLATPLP